mgnify:CR=1 FL=1
MKNKVIRDAVRFNAKGDVIIPFHRVGHDRPNLAEVLDAVSRLPRKEAE